MKTSKIPKRVYLAEARIAKYDSVEPLGIYSTKAKAVKAIGNQELGLVSELVIDKTYSDGIGIANHWHLNEPDDNEN